MVGATGKVGRHVVAQLDGVEVCALVRSEVPLPAGVRAVRGDLTRPETLDVSADAVFLMWPFDSADGVRDVLAALKGRVVYLSSAGVEVATDAINVVHAEVEREIERSGLDWTFLRAGGFAGGTLDWGEQIRAGDVVRDSFGSASRSLIHEADIAAVAVRALTEPGHEGVKYVLTGPESLTQREQVRIIGEELGRPLRFVEIPREQVLKEMVDGGIPERAAEEILSAYAAMGEASQPVYSTVEDVTGVPARTYREWVRDHLHEFAG